MNSDYWQRDQPRFYDIFGLPWETIGSVPPLGSLDGKLLSKSRDGMSSTCILRFAPGWRREVRVQGGCLELFILEGQLSLNKESFGTSGFLVIPPECTEVQLSSEGGGIAIAFWNADFQAGYYYDGTAQGTRTSEVRWTTTAMEGVTSGIQHKSLRWPDPTGALSHGGPNGMIRLTLIPPGFNDARDEVHHSGWEEFLWLTGDYFKPGRGRCSFGTYMANPTGVWHNPPISQRGCLVLMHTDGPIDVEFRDSLGGRTMANTYQESSWLAEHRHADWRSLWHGEN